MMKNIISLAEEALFPIVKDIEGNTIEQAPATGFSIAGTIQGEGKLAGVPSLFIRFSSCNLRCIWKLPDGGLSRCDTPYASFDNHRVKHLSSEELLMLVKQNLGQIRHIVISGGEPLLQKDALIDLSVRLKSELGLHITLETNGTIFNREACEYIDLFSISPKLGNSTPDPSNLKALGLNPSGPLNYHGSNRLNLKALQSFLDLCNSRDKELQLKFVVASPEEEKEIIEDYLQKLSGWRASDILLMPLGATVEELKQTTLMAMEMAVCNGWRYSPRIHIDLFGSKPGV